jgi:hypothetical protein
MSNGAKPIYITFKGIKTFSDNPASSKTVYFDIKRDQGYESLVNLTSKLISEFLDKQILSKDQLSHVKFENG